MGYEGRTYKNPFMCFIRDYNSKKISAKKFTKVIIFVSAGTVDMASQIAH